MEPTIGRTVQYRLTAQDATAINRRRTTGAEIRARMTMDPPQWPAGAQAHIGNPATAGDVVPLIIVSVRADVVNGQALLDGNDVLWITSAEEGSEPGMWSWPPRIGTQ